jgi:hypothetical protein
MMKDETAGAEIGEFAGLRAKCYALSIERPDMEIDFNNAESTYTRATCEQSPQGRNMPGLITSITKYIGGVLRSFVKDPEVLLCVRRLRRTRGSRRISLLRR